jgi:TPP-dependent indolepyruvate ferredoxin oxidoreductase alpha subunit
MTAAVAGPMKVRVTVADAWETFALEAAVGESAASLKLRALVSARIDGARAAGYEMKVGGALVRDESKPLAVLGVRTGAALVVLSRRRRPVR